jgi:hypothetical protein
MYYEQEPTEKSSLLVLFLLVGLAGSSGVVTMSLPTPAPRFRIRSEASLVDTRQVTLSCLLLLDRWNDNRLDFCCLLPLKPIATNLEELPPPVDRWLVLGHVYERSTSQHTLHTLNSGPFSRA